MKQYLAKYTIHVWVLPIFFVLYCYNEPSQRPEFAEIAIVISCVYFLVLVLYGSFRWFISNRINSGIGTTISIFVLLFFQYFLFALNQFSSYLEIFRGRFLLPLILSALAIFIFFLRNRVNSLTKFNLFLNIFLIANVCIESIKLFNKHPTKSFSLPSKGAVESSNEEIKQRLDVYVILSDAYTSPVALEKFWNYDNKPFLDSLKKKGFDVVMDAKSSYKYTFRTMSSVWSMDYLPVSLNDRPESFEKDQALFDTINSNKSSRWFYSKGYDCKNFTSYGFWGQKANVKQGNYNDFRRKVYSKTLVSYLLGPVQDYWFANSSDALKHQELIESVKAVAHPTPKPKFVFCHLMLPHDPYILDEDGHLVRSWIPMNDHPEKYLAQLKYTNKLIMNLVNHLTSLPTKPIIVLMGDHGFRQFNTEPKRTIASYSAFSAFYFPSQDYSEIPRNLSSVNIMRLVCNQLQPKSFELLPNKSNFYYE